MILKFSYTLLITTCIASLVPAPLEARNSTAQYAVHAPMPPRNFEQSCSAWSTVLGNRQYITGNCSDGLGHSKWSVLNLQFCIVNLNGKLASSDKYGDRCSCLSNLCLPCRSGNFVKSCARCFTRASCTEKRLYGCSCHTDLQGNSTVKALIDLGKYPSFCC